MMNSQQAQRELGEKLRLLRDYLDEAAGLTADCVALTRRLADLHDLARGKAGRPAPEAQVSDRKRAKAGTLIGSFPGDMLALRTALEKALREDNG